MEEEIKGKDYFGVGSDEYDFYKTIDNGKTWKHYIPGGGIIFPVPHSYPPIFIIDHKPGITKFPEDTPIPFIDTKKDPEDIISKKYPVGWPNNTDGWPLVKPEPEIIGSDSNNVYIKDTPGPGPIYGFPNGKPYPSPEPSPEPSPVLKPNPIIEEIGPGTGPFIKEKDKTTCIYGKKDKLTIDKEDKDRNSFDVLPEELYEKFLTLSIEDLLLFVLNDVLIPKSTFLLANRYGLEDLYYDKFNKNPTFFTNKEIYKTENGIDFINDVGMSPLVEADLNEYKDIKKSQEKIIEDLNKDDIKEKKIENMLLQNNKLSLSFEIIEEKLNNFKQYVLSHELKKITNSKENYEGLKPEEVPYMKSFYNIRKGAEESILGTIITSIFTFNNSKKMALLKTSILDIAYFLKDGINMKIHILYNKIHSGIFNKEEILSDPYFLNLLTFDIKEEWCDSLDRCIKRYYREAVSNIYLINKKEDKDLIYEASDKYKENRTMLIDNITDSLNDIDNYDIDKDVSLKEALNFTSDLINNFKVNVESIISSDNFIKEMDTLLKNYKEEEKEILKKYKIVFSSICNFMSSSFNQNINIKFDDMKDVLYFNNLDINDLKLNYGLNEIDRIYNYYDQILKEFKKRCITLLNMAGDNIVNNTMNSLVSSYVDIRIWSDKLINSKDRKQFIEDNTLDYIVKDIKENCKDFEKMVKSEWKNIRGAI